jgi:hypothetical protein
MSIRNLFSCLLILAASFTLSPRAFAQGEWAVEKTFHVGEEGGFDYITVDAKSHRLYVPRSTHTMVIDADSGNTVADITGQKHNHGVAVVPELSRGFISDGAGSIIVFDLKTNAVLGTVAAKDDADGIVYDKSSGLVLVACGDAGVLVTLKADADPKTAVIDAPIELGGKPEFLAADGAGKVYVNLEDKDQVAVVDLKARKVLAHWPVAPGGSPVGLAIDTNTHRLFIGCRKPQKMLHNEHGRRQGGWRSSYRCRRGRHALGRSSGIREHPRRQTQRCRGEGRQMGDCADRDLRTWHQDHGHR